MVFVGHGMYNIHVSFVSKFDSREEKKSGSQVMCSCSIFGDLCKFREPGLS